MFLKINSEAEKMFNFIKSCKFYFLILIGLNIQLDCLFVNFEEIKFIVDHPFLFILRDVSSITSTLFIGAIKNFS